MGLSQCYCRFMGIDVYAGPFDDGSLGHKYFDGSGWFPSNDYQNIGGSLLKGPPLAISWGHNRNDVFAVGQDNQLWHKALSGSTWNPSLSGWQNLGGNLSFNDPLAAVSRSANHLDVFGVREEADGSKSLWRKSWNGAGWAPSALGFEHIEGNFSTAPSVVSRLHHEVTLYIVDLQGNLLHRWWDSRTDKWSTWTTIGTQFRSTPAAVSTNSSRSDIFSIGVDGALYDVIWVHGEFLKEKQNMSERYPVSSVSVQKQHDDVISIYAIDIYGHAASRLWSGEWNSWIDHYGYFGYFYSPFAQASWGSERLDVFGYSADYTLRHQWYQRETGWKPAQYEFETLAGEPVW